MPGSATTPAIEAVFTIAPPPCFSIWRISCFMQRKTPRRSTDMISSKASSGTSASGAVGGRMPALLKAQSSRP